MKNILGEKEGEEIEAWAEEGEDLEAGAEEERT